MPPRRSFPERLPREPQTGGTRTLREDVPVGVLERFEGREPAAGEQPDGATDPTADPLLEHRAASEQAGGPVGLEAEQPGQRLVGRIEDRDVETAPILRRHVDAAEREVAGDVLEEV